MEDYKYIESGKENITTVFIKNMVCNRCITAVQKESNKLGLVVKNIRLGEVTLDKELITEQKTNPDSALFH